MLNEWFEKERKHDVYNNSDDRYLVCLAGMVSLLHMRDLVVVLLTSFALVLQVLAFAAPVAKRLDVLLDLDVDALCVVHRAHGDRPDGRDGVVRVRYRRLCAAEAARGVLDDLRLAQRNAHGDRVEGDAD